MCATRGTGCPRTRRVEKTVAGYCHRKPSFSLCPASFRMPIAVAGRAVDDIRSRVCLPQEPEAEKRKGEIISFPQWAAHATAFRRHSKWQPQLWLAICCVFGQKFGQVAQGICVRSLLLLMLVKFSLQRMSSKTGRAAFNGRPKILWQQRKCGADKADKWGMFFFNRIRPE